MLKLKVFQVLVVKQNIYLVLLKLLNFNKNILK